MAESPHKFVAFAGTSKVNKQNVESLLNDYFHDLGTDDVTLVFPAAKTHLKGGLLTAYDWVLDAEVEYGWTAIHDGTHSKDVDHLLEFAVDSVEVSTNVNGGIIEYLDEAKQDDKDVALILIYGEEGDKDTETLLDLATSAGIPVLDLSAGLDELRFTEDEEEAPPAPEPEPEPEEKPARRTRGRARTQKVEEEALTDEDVKKDDPEPEEKPARRRSSTKTKEKVLLAKPVAPTSTPRAEGNPEVTAAAKDVPEEIVSALEAVADAVAALGFSDRANKIFYGRTDDADEASLLVRITRAHEVLTEFASGQRTSGVEESQKADAAPSRGRGRPRNDGEPTRTRTAAQKAVTEVWNEDDEVWERKGRGRIPKGVKTRLVDPKTGEEVEPDED